jgi:hypothetical protein
MAEAAAGPRERPGQDICSKKLQDYTSLHSGVSPGQVRAPLPRGLNAPQLVVFWFCSNVSHMSLKKLRSTPCIWHIVGSTDCGQQTATKMLGEVP